jgi:hypothetical protein
LGGKVHQTIISSIQKAKYYSVIFDTTVYSVHIEQMLQTDSSPGIQGDFVKIQEAFIDIGPLDVETISVITVDITKKLEQN